jgi:hypothetical protein
VYREYPADAVVKREGNVFGGGAWVTVADESVSSLLVWDWSEIPDPTSPASGG